MIKHNKLVIITSFRWEGTDYLGYFFRFNQLTRKSTAHLVCQESEIWESKQITSRHNTTLLLKPATEIAKYSLAISVVGA